MKRFINGVALLMAFGYSDRSAKSTIALARNKGKLECDTPEGYNVEETSAMKWLNESSKNSRGKVYLSGVKFETAMESAKELGLFVPAEKKVSTAGSTKKTLTLLLQELAEMSVENHDYISANRPDIIEKAEKLSADDVAAFIEQA